MIAPPSSTSETMLRAIAYTMAALDAASLLDIDRTAEEREFFSEEKSSLEKLFEKLLKLDESLRAHNLKETLRLQASVQVGDSVLERGVKNAKARMKLEMQNSKADTVDYVFGSNLKELFSDGLRKKPATVMQLLSRLESVLDFAGKDKLKTELEERINQQEKAFSEREQGEELRAKLLDEVELAISECSEALYKLEKQLLARFPRDRNYVNQFFFDVAPVRKTKQAKPPQSGT